MTQILKEFFLRSYINNLNVVKTKGKVVCLFFTEHHAMWAYWRSRCIDPRIIDLHTRWRWVVSFTLRPIFRWDCLK